MNNIFKIAAWSFLISLIFGLIGPLLGNNGIFPIDYTLGISSALLIVYNLISMTLLILVWRGFIALGKKFNNQLLLIVSWLGIILLIIYYLYILFGGFVFNIPSDLEELQLSLSFGHVILSLLLGLITILFGISLLRMKKQVRYSKTAGILNIISGATLIIFVGYLLIIVAIIFEILLLFNASKRFK